MKDKKFSQGTSLVVWWLRMCASIGGGMGLSLAGELRSHMPCSVAKNKNKQKTLKSLINIILIPFVFS